MTTKTTPTDIDRANINTANKTFIFRKIENFFIGLTSFLLLGVVTFPMIVALIFFAQLTASGHLESGLSYVLFG